MKFPQNVTLYFNPLLRDATLSYVFCDTTCRTLYLLWRVSHIVDENFPRYVIEVAKTIRKRMPKSVDDLADCFPRLHVYWTPRDVREFSEHALPYFTGEASIDYEVSIDLEPEAE